MMSAPPSIPTFENLTKENKFQVRIVITTSRTMGLAEWTIDGTHVLPFLVLHKIQEDFEDHTDHC